jgi:hypothetical protein
LLFFSGQAYFNKTQTDKETSDLIPLPGNPLEQLLNQQLAVLEAIKVSVAFLEPSTNEVPKKFGQPTGPGVGDQ